MKRAVVSLMLAAMVLTITVLSSFAMQDAAPKADAPPVVDALTLARLQVIGLQQQLELVSAQRDMCVGQLAPSTYKTRATDLDTVTKTIVGEYEKAHPGWTIDTKTGTAVKK